MAKLNCDNLGTPKMGQLLFRRQFRTPLSRPPVLPTEEDKQLVRDWVAKAPQRAMDFEEDTTLDLVNLVLFAEEKLGPADKLLERVTRLEKARRRVFHELFTEAARECAFRDEEEME